MVRTLKLTIIDALYAYALTSSAPRPCWYLPRRIWRFSSAASSTARDDRARPDRSAVPSLLLARPLSSWKEDHGLAVQAGQPRDRAKASSSLEIESDDFVLSDTIEPGRRAKAQPPRLLKLHAIRWNKHPHQTPISPVIFSDRRYRICSTERMLAAHDDIAVRRDRKVERTEIWISCLP